ncbi:MAG TPA: hypothetical protein DC057_12100 [Spirochaetia bacterium]|nr:hypothetical protein [Spirochaetia bacterium]
MLKYLSRHIHKVGISNKRIKSYDGDYVIFSHRDRKDDNIEKEMKIPALLFVPKFILHIVPKMFVKMQFYDKSFQKKACCIMS